MYGNILSRGMIDGIVIAPIRVMTVLNKEVQLREKKIV